MARRDWIRIVVLSFVATGVPLYFLSTSSLTQKTYAYSSGPPAGFTGAPGEFTCAECHVPESQGSGQITLTVPTNYVPGQTYQIAVHHFNSDPSRIRWGFELTAMDDGAVKAGDLQSTDNLTQVLNNQGPGGLRQYIEHTSLGTFFNQTGGATWTFNWTAPSTDVGRVTFYVAGNQANGDGNTSGDFIHFTFAESFPVSDFTVSATPASQNVLQGGNAPYNVTVTPSGGFVGQVSLSVSGLPSGALATFNPTSININDASPKSSTMTVSAGAETPIGSNTLNITGMNGGTQHSTSVKLKVTNPANADLGITQTISPNPALRDTNLSYRIIVTNSGPATATNVIIIDNLAAGFSFVSSTPSGVCTGTQNLTCTLGSLASGASSILTIVATPTVTGSFTNTTTAAASQTDPDTSDNSAAVNFSVIQSATNPSMIDPHLSVRTVVSQLSQPTSMAFIGNDDFFVLEKDTGKIQRVVNGVVQSTVLDLAVNSASERGLLGIALHPNFLLNGFVYLYWTESSTGFDSTNLADVTTLGNRVDRYIWNGATLSFDRNLIRLRAYQADANQPLRGNHNGGVLRFGPDGKLYILMGDNGRRGFLQNNQMGLTPDDQFGGPEPDDNHLTGFILRLNDDGSTPTDNPFYNAQTTLSGEAAANIKKLYGYGVRNGFGMAFDPLSGNLWTQENGDDCCDEMNRVTAGFNGGWVQINGPVSRIADFKQIETTYGAGNLQQLRWPPSQIADTSQDALSRLYMLPGSHYTDPEFTWKYAVAPSPLGFVQGRGLGFQYEGNMFVGAARTFLDGGYLFRFKLTPDRLHYSFSDPRLNDLVADNIDKFDITESESLLAGKDFGITTDIETSPNGDLYVVSNTNGAVYEISSAPPTVFVANLNGAQETPPNNSTAAGTASLLLSPDETTALVTLSFSGLSSTETGAHIHGPAPPGISAPILFPIPTGQVSDFRISLSAAQVQDLKNGQLYINVHSNNFPNGEIRGQFGNSVSTSSIQFSAASYFTTEAAGRAVTTVTRIGNTGSAASVDYTTSDSAGLNNCNVITGIASQRCDYVASLGTLRFAAGETSKTISVPLIDDAYSEGSETFMITLTNPSGAVLGSPNVATITITDTESTTAPNNPIDSTNFFVRQQYIDFLGREPDPPGFNAWVNEINNCTGDTTLCDRIHVSQLFFQSAEFQQRGYFVYRFYPVSFGRKPFYSEFVPDLASVSGFLSDAQLEAAKVQFITNFMARPAFANTYNSLTNQQYVDTLLNTAGVTLSSRQTMIDGLNNSTLTRAQVLRQIVESPEVATKYFNQAYAVMEYFGYLRREPDAAYLDWIHSLDTGAQPRTMVIGFVNSIEYRQRFGLP